MASERTLSLSDIARLAQVQRPSCRCGVGGLVPAALSSHFLHPSRPRDLPSGSIATRSSRGSSPLAGATTARHDSTHPSSPPRTTRIWRTSPRSSVLLRSTGEELAGLDEDQIVALAEGVDEADQLLLREVRTVAPAGTSSPT